MVVDRALQKELLGKLAEAYPESVSSSDLGETTRGGPISTNLIYLDEHGLVEALQSKAIGAAASVHTAKITARGLDFLADDGGLSAILTTVTVKLHADTLEALLAKGIRESELPRAVKDEVLAKLKTLPAEAMGKIADQLLGLGIEKLPDAVSAIRSMLGF
ncbi:hypothetical protein [Chitinimonas sp.]|uniref:hypothetical protein n=1 Tax=Chitinimonas sp. TaxID=1934313 RepID=UPI0035B31843